MLEIILGILRISGITVLILLGVVLFFLLLILFFPISYRVTGEKRAVGDKNDTEEKIDEQLQHSADIKVRIRALWLFGIVRMLFDYPKPGKMIIKLLGITVYDAGKQKDRIPSEEKKNLQRPGQQDQSFPERIQSVVEERVGNTDATGNPGKKSSAEADAGEQKIQSTKGFIRSKTDKIKYTILKIYDKIKYILEDIKYYKTLWEEETTKMLLNHFGVRFLKIWKNIHPRKVKADIVFGTGSPDTTGYILGMYAIISPMLGKDVNIQADFEKAVLQGEMYLSGHVTIFNLLLHGIMLGRDPNLKRLITRLKEHRTS